MSTATRPSFFKRFLPLIIFALLVVVLAIGLKLNPREVPSPYIDKPMPAFDLPLLFGEGRMTQDDIKGEITLVNVWASWCFACRQEHQTVLKIADSGVRVIGFNYKDKADDAKDWLRRLGNPYTKIVSDLDGRAGIDWGVYGAPETFLIDAQGIIRHKVIGPLSDPAKLEELQRVMAGLNGAGA